MKKGVAKIITENLLRGVILLIAVVIVTFLLVNASPIDPISAHVGSRNAISEEQRAAIAEYWGLNEPLAGRLVSWLKALANGDMGRSYYFQQPVTAVIGERFAQSTMLVGVVWMLSGIFGFLLGAISAACHNSPIGRATKAICLLLSSSPAFWLGLLSMIVFAVKLGWFPLGLSAPISKLAGEVTIWERLHHLVLPAATLSITGVSNIALYTRQKLIDIMESDFVLFAQARGEGKWQAIRRHGFRNILSPAVTLQFAAISELFGGSALAENVSSYTGIEQAVVLARTHGDTPLLMGIALFGALFVFCENMVVNLLHPVIDPQIREIAHAK